MKGSRTKVILAAALPAMLLIGALASRDEPVQTQLQVPTSTAASWPLSVRYEETLEEAGLLLSRNVYQFTGASWDDFSVVLLSSSNDAGPLSQGQIGYVSRYRNGALMSGWLRGASNELERLSIDQVNALLEAFPTNAESVQESTVPGGEQAPSPLFNRRWLKFEGLVLPDDATTSSLAADEDSAETSTVATSDVAGTRAALSTPGAPIPEAAVEQLLDLPADAVVTVAGGDGSSTQVESRKEIVFAVTSEIPLAGRVTTGPILETLLATGLGPPAPTYAGRPSADLPAS